MPTGNLPIKKIKNGSVSASIFKNEGSGSNGDYVFYSVSLERSYKDKEGTWQRTNSYKYNDLPAAQYVLREAYDFIAKLKSQPKEEDQSSQEENKQSPATKEKSDEGVVDMTEVVM